MTRTPWAGVDAGTRGGGDGELGGCGGVNVSSRMAIILLSVVSLPLSVFHLSLSVVNLSLSMFHLSSRVFHLSLSVFNLSDDIHSPSENLSIVFNGNFYVSFSLDAQGRITQP